MHRGTSLASPTRRRTQHAQQAAPYSVGSGGDAGERIRDGASVGPTVFNIMKDSFSVASLALPFAMQQAGPVPTLLLIVIMGIVCCHTAKLLSYVRYSGRSDVAAADTFADQAYHKIVFGHGTSISILASLRRLKLKCHAHHNVRPPTR